MVVTGKSAAMIVMAAAVDLRRSLEHGVVVVLAARTVLLHAFVRLFVIPENKEAAKQAQVVVERTIAMRRRALLSQQESTHRLL